MEEKSNNNDVENSLPNESKEEGIHEIGDEGDDVHLEAEPEGGIKLTVRRTKLHSYIYEEDDFDFPLEISDSLGWTAMHHACSVGDLAVSSLLRDRGANYHARDHLGLVPGDFIANTDVGDGEVDLEANDLEPPASPPPPWVMVSETEVYSGATLTVTVNSGSALREDGEYVQFYYAYEEPWKLTPRMGSYKYIPVSFDNDEQENRGVLSLQMHTRGLPAGNYRALYYRFVFSYGYFFNIPLLMLSS